MPIVTLLRPYEKYLLGMGSQVYSFFQGVPVECSEEIANRCAGIKFKNKPMFRIEGRAGDADPDADVNRFFGLQLEFRP